VRTAGSTSVRDGGHSEEVAPPRCILGIGGGIGATGLGADQASRPCILDTANAPMQSNPFDQAGERPACLGRDEQRPSLPRTPRMRPKDRNISRYSLRFVSACASLAMSPQLPSIHSVSSPAPELLECLVNLVAELLLQVRAVLVLRARRVRSFQNRRRSTTAWSDCVSPQLPIGVSRSNWRPARDRVRPVQRRSSP
jgi:hypothetical protein